MAIRPATGEDVGAIRRIAADSWERDYPDVVSRESAESGVHDWYDEETVATEVDRPDAVMLVEERDGNVVGFVHGVYSQGEGHLLRAYVAPDHRGAGVGGRLVEEACTRLFDVGADRVRAMVLAENEPGNRFYLALGFERVEETYETEVGGEFYEERVWVREG